MRKHSFVAKAGLILPLLVLCVCAFGFLLAPNDPDLVDLTKKFLSPCSQFPLGTDNLGRCVLSRLLYGGRTTLGIVLVGSVTVSVLGTLIGLLMGGGKNGKNLILEGVLNAVTAIPPIAYLIIFIAAWGNSVFTMVVAVSASLLLRVIKLVQTRTEIEQGKAYVMCAVASGARPRRILFVHILPNLVWDVLHFICLSCADMTLSIVSFSFIGLGMGDNVVDWGSMVSETHHYLLSYPGLTLYPVLMIVVCTMAFHTLGRWIERNGTQLLKQISFQIEIGEAVGLTGQSGAGKTTLLKALLGILSGGCQVSGGTIQVDGQSLWALSPRKRRELCGTTLGFIPQNPMTAFDPRLKLGRQMEETLRLRTGVSGKEAVEQAEALLAELGLSQPRRVLDSYPAQLSGGMLQRAAAALLMALHPKYILADEPTSALDAENRTLLLELLEKQRETAGILFISHDVAALRALCGTVYVMEHGMLTEQGTMQELLEHPKQAWTKEYAEANRPASREGWTWTD